VEKHLPSADREVERQQRARGPLPVQVARQDREQAGRLPAPTFDFIRHHTAYLNPNEHEQQGIPDLVTRSALTSRRFDALKIRMTLQTNTQ
jgi:hypothetical protein